MPLRLSRISRKVSKSESEGRLGKIPHLCRRFIQVGDFSPLRNTRFEIVTAMTTQIQNSVQPTVKLTPAQEEAAAFLARVESLAVEGNGLGAEALQEVARKLGASANKFGRPALVQFTGFALAMSGRNLSFNARVGLAQVANGAAAAWAKPAFRTATKVSEIEGNLSFKLNMPAQFETAIG